ncbi:CHAP domain-containing protein [Methylobacterium sp. E-041]|uniref:CHAP domain-containing protein n=1 Tax=Methylobacterium sp. E-041 TaxID=2836573 RepID=UPI001FBB37A3|nr:CHAP domain-containing protein [Methylobacterium sp. E-041]MCJ2103823.1 CHAP domain-containing protein [Methylobacterium sp. E-041]
MLSRRALTFGVPLFGATVIGQKAYAQPSGQTIGVDAEFDQLPLPPLSTLDDPEVYGYRKPNAEQMAKAKNILDSTPKGATPYAIAKSFIDRYSQSDPGAISQWPAPAAWNPVVKEFFSATSLRAQNDMINWCAAFANWCIERNNKKGTDSASSQSFVNSGKFLKINTPTQGDLVVFTCYDKQSGKTLGLGHVAFFESSLGNDQIMVVGGNQSADGHSSIISERRFSTKPFDSHRHVGEEYVPCTFALNSFLKVA